MGREINKKNAFKEIHGLATKVGLSEEETITFIKELKETGIKASWVGSNLKKTLIKISEENKGKNRCQ